MRFIRTILLGIIAILCLVSAILLTMDGNLSRLIGHSAFNKGERLFPYSREDINEINWMRIETAHDRAVSQRLPNGIWWMSYPWDDRMDPVAAAALLQFTYSTEIVDALPLNNTVRGSMREFGLETAPVDITLKNISPQGKGSTLARYTLGSLAPWIIPHVQEPGENQSKPPTATTYMKSDFYGDDDRILVATGSILPLFKEGVRQLRDHHPLLLPPLTIPSPAQPRKVEINNRGKAIVITRKDGESPWLIESPLPLKTDPAAMQKLLVGLQKLTAFKVHDPKDSPLPDIEEKELTTITLTPFEGTPVTLSLYPPDAPAAKSVKAIVSDRKAVFDLPLDTYDNIPGIAAIPFDLASLRTKQIGDIDRRAIKAISIRGKSGFPIILKYTESDPNSQRKASWSYDAEGSEHNQFNEEQLYTLLKTLTEGSIKGVASDSPTDLGAYGLDNPELYVAVSLKNSPPIMLLFGKGMDNSWHAMQEGKPTVYQVDESYVRAFPTEELNWKPKKLINFSRFDLRELWLERIGQAPLILKYNHLYDTWEGIQDGKNITVDINPNRANNYLNALEKMKVDAWLGFDNLTAADSLKTPVFRLKLILESVEDEEPGNHSLADGEKESEMESFSEKTVTKEIIMEIAPAGEVGFSPYYFGKINDSPYFFILPLSEVRMLGGSVFEQE